MPRHTSRDDVLLLLTDQERYDLTGPGGLPVETSALDGLADGGVRFTRAYTPISICSSARASLLSGKYPHRHGVLNNVHERDAIQPNLPTGVPTFGTLLREAGYANTYVGKWHVGRDATPEDFGFEYLGGSDEHHDGHLEGDFRAYREELGVDPEAVELEDTVHARYPDYRHLIAGRTSVPPEATRPYYIAERTVERLERAAEEDGPFLHRTDFLGPHHPYVVPEPYASMYDPEEIDPWPTYRETFAGKPRVQENYLEYRGVESFAWDDWAEAISLYMGFMHLIDDQVGRILDALDEFGLREDTLVVHASDHGDFAGSHRQFNKGPLMYEDTYRIPLSVAGPGVAGDGRECDELVSLIDLMPTFVELAGASVPDGVDGRSLWPLLEDRAGDDDVEERVGDDDGGEHAGDDEGNVTDAEGRGGEPENRSRGTREAVFGEYHGDEFGLYSQRMVRTDRYKYVLNVPDVDELYDLRTDPHELVNLVDHPHYREERRRLRALLEEWMAETADPIHEWSSRYLRSDPQE